jgi:hypothetical protein
MGSSPNGRDPASRSRDLRGSVTPAKAGGIEPVPAQPDAPIRGHRKLQFMIFSRCFGPCLGCKHISAIFWIALTQQKPRLASQAQVFATFFRKGRRCGCSCLSEEALSNSVGFRRDPVLHVLRLYRPQIDDAPTLTFGQKIGIFVETDAESMAPANARAAHDDRGWNRFDKYILGHFPTIISPLTRLPVFALFSLIIFNNTKRAVYTTLFYLCPRRMCHTRHIQIWFQ